MAEMVTDEAVPTQARAKRLARWRKPLAWLLLALPMLLSVMIDWGRRSERLAELDSTYRWMYVGAAFESLIVWGLLLYAASRRRGKGRNVAAVLFVVMTTFAFGGQSYFYSQYNAYMNEDVSMFASNFMDSVVNQLFADIGNYLKAKLPVMVLAILLVWVARRVVRPKRRPARIAGVVAPLLLIGAFFIPVQHRHLQAATPDTLYLNAVGGLLRTQLGMTDQSHQMRPRVRNSLPVAPLKSQAETPRNVVFILLESVRWDATCNAFEPGCEKTGHTNTLVPERYHFDKMRSMASCTAISLAVTWSGLQPVEDRETLHTWPLIFDYAKAAGWNTAFYTSQNMMFGNARLWVKNLGVDQFVSATELEPTADLDMGAHEGLLADYVNANIGKLKEPYLAVIQLSNVHYPYLVDPNLPQPFQPATTSKAPDDNPYFYNQYLNSVHQQDMHLSRIVKQIKDSDAGKRTVIVYTSDHAEAFREHNQMGHTFSIFDEETHVPMWIDAPQGTLNDDQRKALKSKQDEYLFHVDIAPTILDIMGLWDEPGVEKYKSKLVGHSLLRPELTTQALPMTNCAGVWSCAFENWGYMRRNMKLEARAWDSGWHCYDLDQDPKEKTNLGVEACGDLKDRAMQTFGRLPGKTPDSD
ncbi:MAG: sulfatase-like hydrolase/transferase [Polyangiaceae bacterium]|nr:sulfatase-like hydrolase/transferase [Polyangiaceae bacterium]MCB9608925.1 sulfatase-like hydrolase/transferase [Polyangiaceae bacterium]